MQLITSKRNNKNNNNNDDDDDDNDGYATDLHVIVEPLSQIFVLQWMIIIITIQVTAI